MSLLNLARKPPSTVDIRTTVLDAIGLMVENRVGAIIVLDGVSLAGIFTERDAMERILYAGRDPAKLLIEDVMTRDVKTIGDSMPVNEAMDLMRQSRISHLPVLSEQGNVLGILSYRYLMHNRQDELLDELHGLQSYIAADGPGG